jgi:cupin 2 domain-containing protein
VTRGRLRDVASAPASGERVEPVVSSGGVVVEQILSGMLHAPVEFVQDHDEWVVVLAGGAVLDVGGETVELAAGDWVLLPSHLPHRVARTEPRTNWLAVHMPPRSSG